ncbi:MAG: helix-turn-helix domain-containing protein [Nitrospirae bacterium]|nr:helix-turn-helix domain-containing protein [Nitrospirota bacterium]MDA8338136.1 helix-turn-helix transcriptional regulator [Nitrospiraceae bacterium]
MPDIKKIFGKNVRTYREAKNLSQEQLADLCGLHRTYISHVECGKRNVSVENIQKIAQALRVKISDLFAGADAKKNK